MVDANEWLSGRLALVPPSQVEGVDWVARQVMVRTGRQTVQNSPANRHEQRRHRDLAADVQRLFEKSI